MSKAVITVEGLGKQYNIGALHKKQQYDTLRDKIALGFKSAKKHLAHRTKTMLGAEKFWALRDVSFEVKKGEILGIIGKNGAGKSTLLKILCRVTLPTEGRASLKGRVGSLLEVGTGFHPELTGRENVYLSGAILGMNKAYIERNIDEIIDFSGIEKFIDTPVKRYSSGMRVRLGFAVAAHLEPEILLIDEVLAVGDITFQKRCLGKMNEITEEGRTVLFVSHNLASIRSLCSNCLLLNKGLLVSMGPANIIVDEYQQSARALQSGIRLHEKKGKYGTILNDLSLEVIQKTGGDANLEVNLKVTCSEIIPVLGIGIQIDASDGALVSRQGPGVTGFVIEKAIGNYSCTLLCENINKYLTGGSYSISINLSIPKTETLLSIRNVAWFSLNDKDLYKTANPLSYNRCGPISLPLSFSVRGNDYLTKGRYSRC